MMFLVFLIDFKFTHSWFCFTLRYTWSAPTVPHPEYSRTLGCFFFFHIRVPEYIYCVSMATITSWKFMFTCNITQNKDKWTSDVRCLNLLQRHIIIKTKCCDVYVFILNLMRSSHVVWFGYCIEVHNGNNVSCRTLQSEGVVEDIQMQADAERLA